MAKLGEHGGRASQAEGLRRGLWHVRPVPGDDLSPTYWTVECPICRAPAMINRSILDEIDAGTKVKCHDCVVRAIRERLARTEWLSSRPQ